MSLSPLAFHLTSLVNLFCLLLVSSSLRLPMSVAVSAKPLTQHNTTETNCSTACDNGGESVAAQETSDVPTTPLQKSLPSISEPDWNQSPSLPSNHTSVGQKINTTASVIPPNQTAGEINLSKPSPSSQQPLLQEHQTGATTTTGITQPERNANTAIVSVISTDRTMPTSTATASTKPVARQSTTTTSTTTTSTTTASTTTTTTTASTTTTTSTTTTKSLTTINSTQNATAFTTTTCVKTMPPTSLAPIEKPSAPNTEMPTTSTITAKSAITPVIQNEPDSRSTVADVAGAARTSQLVDKVSLYAVLLFGLLFFLVAVAMFITQAYKSYRRRDYTQVDYLINGMYSDSGV